MQWKDGTVNGASVCLVSRKVRTKYYCLLTILCSLVINGIACEAKGILESLTVWFRYNQLTKYLSKTCYTIFGRHMYGTSVPLLLQDKQTKSYPVYFFISPCLSAQIW